MRKKVGIIKRLFTLLLVFLLSINSFAAIVSDNDGSAFITKSEFDALKSSFQSQIDTYNQSIDSKIDGAIASYLAGIKLASQVDCVNLLEKINNGGHSGLDLTFGKDLGYLNVGGYIEANMSYWAQSNYVPTNVSKGTVLTVWLLGSAKEHFYNNTSLLPVLNDANTAWTGVWSPNINFAGTNSFLGRGGGDSFWYTHNPTQAYTWLSYSTYVNPFGMSLGLDAGGSFLSAKSNAIQNTTWGFVEGFIATCPSATILSAWDHSIDFITQSTLTQKDWVCISGHRKINGKIAITTDGVAQRGGPYTGNVSTTYTSAALEQASTSSARGWSTLDATDVSVASQWTPIDWSGITSNNIYFYKNIGVKLTSGTEHTQMDLNEVDWPSLTSVDASCKSPKYGIPLYKIPGDGECELKIKFNTPVVLTLYCGTSANTTWTGGDSRLPKGVNRNANTEYTYKFNANKDEILYIAVKPQSTASAEYAKIVSMSCVQTVDT